MIVYKCDKCMKEVPYDDRFFVYANNEYNENLFSERLLCRECANELKIWFGIFEK